MYQSSRLYLERRLVLLYGAESKAIRALDLVVKEMCAEKGYHRYDGSDYYMHCVDVANFLITYGITDEDAITAALLHDIIEDVPGYTEAGLGALFSPAAARYVDAVSMKPGLDYHDGRVLTAYLDLIAANPYTAAIKTADRMHNMYTLAEAAMEKRYRKALETEEFFIPFFKTCRKKYPRYEGLFQAAKTQILPQIYEIRAHYADYEKLLEARAALEAQSRSV